MSTPRNGVPKETIDENIMFQRKTNACTVIINCTQTKIENPQHPVSQQATYFNYKSANTLKVLAALSHRKESAAPLTAERDGTILGRALSYPLALVLRLRVLQIVCGISTMVMGSVAFIEERQKFNMGLGIPAGSLSVLAAAVSIHTSRGWGVVTNSAAAGAIAGLVLWMTSGCFLIVLIVQCCRTILDPPGLTHGDGPTEEDSQPSSRDLIVIASIQIILAIATLLSAVVCARIDYNA